MTDDVSIGSDKYEEEGASEWEPVYIREEDYETNNMINNNIMTKSKRRRSTGVRE